MTSAYDIVNESPYFKNWIDSLGELSADIELEQDQTLIELRKSIKKLIKNNFIAAGAQLAYVNAVMLRLVRRPLVNRFLVSGNITVAVFGDTIIKDNLLPAYV